VSTVRVLLVDDHQLVRKGIRVLLEKLPGIEIVGEEADGHEAMRLIAELHPDVAFVNISMPGLNGLEVTVRAVKQYPRTRIIVLSMHADDEYVRRALRAGASGYLLKSADLRELELAVRAVGRGETWLSGGLSQKLLAGLARGAPPRAGPLDMLTPRQREVLQLVAEGHSTKQIAVRLNLSPKTVETHRAQLMDRLGVRGVPALVRCAIRLGIVRPES
jgi:DNA-binding NarL/FixJ family response regulator